MGTTKPREPDFEKLADDFVRAQSAVQDKDAERALLSHHLRMMYELGRTSMRKELGG